MKTLKEITWDYHQEAERQEFVKELMAGNIDKQKYAIYLFNLHATYDMLEALAMMHGILNDVPQLRRAPRILEDANELWSIDIARPSLLPATNNYLKHLLSIAEDPHKLTAHVYVRHLGDLFGGQMIAKKVPGSGKYYEFEGDRMQLIELVRAKTDESMGDEAIIAFKHATEILRDMNDLG